MVFRALLQQIGFVRTTDPPAAPTPCRPSLVAVRAEIGFVFPKPLEGPIHHNPFPERHLPSVLFDGKLALFRTFRPPVSLKWEGSTHNLLRLTLDTSHLKLLCPIGFVLPKPPVGQTCHNSFPARWLPFMPTRDKLALFCTIIPAGWHHQGSWPWRWSSVPVCGKLGLLAPAGRAELTRCVPNRDMSRSGARSGSGISPADTRKAINAPPPAGGRAELVSASP